ncbi:peptide-methionine (S)-S-oxide reductase MsrA [Patescibacteria group bacterium]|nr:peptide-methionine (S)-S-oxide reductase MsrA [Patescibacteria group bacterium]
MQAQQAIFAAGCFWGVEEAFRKLPGVTEAEVGYTGGTTDHPTYGQVCTGTTQHAEAVRVTFDPRQISYRELVDRFWSMHNPTTYHRQGPDVGSQYRSAIFFYDEAQCAEAEQSKEIAQKQFTSPIVTEIVPAAPFYRAEEEHQRYFEKHGGESCHF